MSTKSRGEIGKDGKVIIQFRAAGDAPILKQSKFKMNAADKFAVVIDFLRKQVHRESVVIFCNSAFSPCPDQLVQDLFKCFHVDGVLVLNYATTVAWG
mmetsp:Transcript_22030/g.36491  ORF Transcript_22030/g.36491 Transcript_22030/m.36491 type:complete len:98 (+) Transcript_22030:371-664(+)